MRHHRILAEISRSAIIHNIRTACRLAGKPLCGVVKADAYGHGAEEVARLCQREGLRYLSVATAEEALQLRAAGLSMPLLVLGYTSPSDAPALAAAGVSQAVFDLGQARALSAALGKGLSLTVHIKADTGMSRLGLTAAEEIAEVLNLPGLRAEGLFTHFAAADCPNDPFTAEQSKRFASLIATLRKKNMEFEIMHCENSGAVIHYTELYGNMARAGLVLYGYSPNGTPSDLWKPAMCLKATIAQVRHLEPGDSVSYGRSFVAQRPTDIAVLSCGYADGYHRSLSGRGSVLIHGHRAPLVGNICMDMMMADISALPPVQAGDTAILFGAEGTAALSLCELAPLAGTIVYELLCAVSARVPRIYID